VRSGLSGSARSITILPPPAELAVGEGFALIALVRGERGAPLPGRAVEWTTDSPDVLHVDHARGSATAVGPGTAMLRASCEAVEAQVRVVVPSDALDSLELDQGIRTAAVQISSPPRSVRAGDSFVLTALPLDSAAQPLLDAPVLWTSSDVQVAVVTAGGWVAALGRGQAVLTATCGLASGSVTIYVEQAQPSTAPPQRPPRVTTAPVAEAESPHRSSWRRRGTRSRGRLVTAAALLLGAAGSVYVFGGLRDFRIDRDREAIPADTIPRATVALDAAVRPESIPPINRGAHAPAAAKPHVVRSTTRRASPVAADPATDSVTLGATADGAAVRDFGGDDTAPVSPSAGRHRALADTARSPGAPPVETEHEVVGYVPMPAGAAAEPSHESTRPPANRAPVRAPTPEKPDDPPLDRPKLEARIRDGVEDCYRAVRSKDLDRLARLYDPKTVADEDKLRRLSRILRTEPWQAVVGRRVDGVRELGSRRAAAEFSFRLTWRDSYGGRLSSQPIFRAEFTREGDDWALSSCRIVGSPKL
jgi:hypothetical protein